MRLSDQDRRRRVIGLTALIDVVFLLLVFFMLASTFLKLGAVKIEAVGGGSGTLDPKSAVLIHVAGSGNYRVNGAPADSGSLVGAINDLTGMGRAAAIIVMRPGTTVDDLVAGLALVRQSRATTIRVVD
jgi:biopolymer transport protein ExbD